MFSVPVARPPGVLLHDIDPLWDCLLREWLHEAGVTVVRAAPDLLITGHGFPRQPGLSPAIATLRTLWPGTPILLLSPTLHAGVAAQGPLAQQLGVQAVLPMPAARESLLNVVRRLLANAGSDRR